VTRRRGGAATIRRVRRSLTSSVTLTLPPIVLAAVAAATATVAMLASTTRAAFAQGGPVGPGDPGPAASSPARALFFEARKLMADGRWSEACPKLEESERLDAGKGTEFNLAECYEHVGRLASALALYERVAVASHTDNMPAHEARARTRAEALAPRVPWVVVVVPEASRADRLEVIRDGELLPAAAWSVRVHVDPGRHTIAARAPGRVPWESAVDLAEGASQTVEVPPLASVEPPPTPTVETPVPAPAPPAPAPAPAQPAEDASTAGRTQRTIAIVVGGAGAASVVAGTVFGALSLVAHNQSDTWCDRTSNQCTQQQGVDARNTAIDRGNVATWLFIAGGVAVSAGTVLWLSAPSARSTPALGVSASGVVVRGEL
jgi:hypothetical protein